MNLSFTRASAISTVELVAACGVALSSVEWLMNARHLRDDGLLSWPISQLRHRVLTRAWVARGLDPIFGYPGVIWVIWLRLLGALLLLSGPHGGVSIAAAVLVAVTTVSITLRSPFGLDGSDQMAAFLFAALALVRLLPHPVVEVTFLWVVALQAALAYFTAGYAKLISGIWRSGAAIPGISSTRMYGSPAAARFVAGRRWLWLAIAWSIILAECTFPLALITPLPIALAILICGAAFHILSGVVMGLNTFIWSFLATYPAVLWCNTRLHL